MLRANGLRKLFMGRSKMLQRPQARTAIYTSNGGILPRPKREFLGLTKLFIVSTPFLYIGGMISMHGASFLEDYDIFVPEDDDDD